MDSAQYTQLWTSSGLVPTKIPTAPPPAMVAYNYRKIMMGEMVKTEDMMSPPMVKWRSERGALYTVAIFDFGFPDGVQYGHWVVSNVRDPWSLQWGDEVFMRDQPFSFCIFRLWNTFLLLALRGLKTTRSLEPLKELRYMMLQCSSTSRRVDP